MQGIAIVQILWDAVYTPSETVVISFAICRSRICRD